MAALSSRRAGALLLALVAAAVVGYLAGHGHGRGAHPGRQLAAAVPGGVVEYPSDWSPASAPAVPGLSLSQAVVLAPGGRAGQGGLLAGQVKGNEPGPLPRSFLTQLHGAPRTEIVDLVGSQAYRYTGVTASGLAPRLTMYALPDIEGSVTLLACYASAADVLAECERIVATLALVGQAQSYGLTPESAYGTRLGAAIAALDHERTSLRATIAGPAPLASLRATATRLSTAFAAAARALGALEPPQAAAALQPALSSALVGAKRAYASLAAAAAEASTPALVTARTRVYEAERSVNLALEEFALIGYSAS